MAIDQGIQLLKETFTYNTHFGTYDFLAIIIIALTLLAITRDVNKWKILFLPTIMAYAVTGLEIGIVYWIIAIVTYSIEIMGYQNIINGTITAYNTTKKTITDFGTLSRHRQETGQHTNILENTFANRNKRLERKAEKKELINALAKTTQGRITAVGTTLANAVNKAKPTPINKGNYLTLKQATTQQKNYVAMMRKNKNKPKKGNIIKLPYTY